MLVRSLLTVISILSICLPGTWCSVVWAAEVKFDVSAMDPAAPESLGSNEMLYLLIEYESDTPLRFQATAMHEEKPLEVGAVRNAAVLHAPGQGQALAWIGYENPTHIDAIRITAIDEEWHKLSDLLKPVDMTWSQESALTPRQPADWVESLIKSERRKSDFVYDPEPQKHGIMYDILFFLTIASIPCYLVLQLHMLWRYKYRWRELAVMPLFPYMILGFYMLTVLDIDRSLQITFLFRYTPFALLYLICLWFAKRFWQNKLPPPKLYKPPKQ